MDGLTEGNEEEPQECEAKLQAIFTNQFFDQKIQNRENHKVQKLS